MTCEWCEMSPCECVDEDSNDYNAAERLLEKVASHDPALAVAMAEAVNADNDWRVQTQTNCDDRRRSARVLSTNFDKEIVMNTTDRNMPSSVSEIPVIFELDSYEADAEATGGVHFFCSTECRERHPSAVYNPCKAGMQPLTDVEPETVCEECGKLVTPPEEVARLRELSSH